MTPLTCAAAAILLAVPLATHADPTAPGTPTTFSTKLVYPGGKPAVDAQAIVDVIDFKTKAVTTFTYKPDATGMVTIPLTPAKAGDRSVLFATSSTAFGPIYVTPPNATSISILEPFTSIRIRLVDAAGKPISNMHVYPHEVSGLFWNPWIPGPWSQTTDSK